MLTTSEGEFNTKNVTRNIVFKVQIYFKNILFLLTSARNLTFLNRHRYMCCVLRNYFWGMTSTLYAIQLVLLQEDSDDHSSGFYTFPC